jgi:cytochrome b
MAALDDKFGGSVASGEMPEATAPSMREVRVWDPIVRLFHWTVVTGCLLNLILLDGGETAHRYVGYAVAAALFVRLFCGFFGSKHARFTDFAPTPIRLRTYLIALAQGREPRYLGHNPAGAVMMLALMALMALLAGVSVTGWLLTQDAFFGDEAMEDLHEVLADAILILAGLHAAAAIVESWRHRENLIWSMITGRKRP